MQFAKGIVGDESKKPPSLAVPKVPSIRAADDRIANLNAHSPKTVAVIGFIADLMEWIIQAFLKPEFIRTHV